MNTIHSKFFCDSLRIGGLGMHPPLHVTLIYTIKINILVSAIILVN